VTKVKSTPRVPGWDSVVVRTGGISQTGTSQTKRKTAHEKRTLKSSRKTSGRVKKSGNFVKKRMRKKKGVTGRRGREEGGINRKGLVHRGTQKEGKGTYMTGRNSIKGGEITQLGG